MTDPTPPLPSATPTATPPTTGIPPNTVTAEEVPDRPDTGNAEAAKYRHRLRQAEGERDGLRDRVDRMQRADVERRAGQQLAVGLDLFDVGRVALTDLLSEDGDVDADRVAEAVSRLLAERPGLAKPITPRGPTIGRHAPMLAAPSDSTSGTWSEVLRSAHR